MAFRIVAGSTLRVSTAGAASGPGRGRSVASIVRQGVCEAAAARGARTHDGQLVRRVAQHAAGVGGCKKVGGLAQRRGGTSRQSPREAWFLAPRQRRAAAASRPPGAPRLLGTPRWARVRGRAPQPGRRQTRRRRATEGWPKVRPWPPSLRAPRLPTVSAAPRRSAAGRCARAPPPRARACAAEPRHGVPSYDAAANCSSSAACSLSPSSFAFCTSSTCGQRPARQRTHETAHARRGSRFNTKAQSQGYGVAAPAPRRCRADSRLRPAAPCTCSGQQRQAARRARARALRPLGKPGRLQNDGTRFIVVAAPTNARGERAPAGPHGVLQGRTARGAGRKLGDA